jgi:aryl-alcohol dehydrogenase-like predicted oxidoreductase
MTSLDTTNYRYFEPLGRPLSRLVLGTLFLSSDSMHLSAPVLDEWVRLGGNVIDTAHDYGFAHKYGFGDCERALGRWLAERADIRDQLVIVSKGGHPNQHRSRVTPEDVTCDLRDTLVRLDGPVDLYLLHRDDPTVPVGPIVDVLNEHKAAGRIRAFGASNWTPQRIDEANAYAAERGLDHLCCSSVHLSLATQSEAHWPGALSAKEAASRAWYERTRMPLFAWSALARAFFTGCFSPGAVNDPAVARVYASEANWERLRRAEFLARRKDATANQVALAWVLQQAFPVYAVIGPRSVEQLRSSFAALEICLDDHERRWLDLEADELE